MIPPRELPKGVGETEWASIHTFGTRSLIWKNSGEEMIVTNVEELGEN